MRSQHNLTVRTPLPCHLPPEEVVAALRTYVPVIKHQALVTRYERTTELGDCIADPFFYGGSPVSNPKERQDAPEQYQNGTSYSLGDGPFVAFNVYERITLIPGIASKEINFPVVFQDAPDGVRARADAPAGVTVWTVFRVRPKPTDSEDVSPATSSPSTTRESSWNVGGWEAEVDRRREYELVEWVTVETNSLLMPFVSRSMEGAHREICQKVLDEVAVRFSWN